MLACQEFKGVFATLVLALAGSDVVFATQPAPAAASGLVPVTASAWSPRPFADVVLETPELAGCFALMPGSWAAARPPASLASAADLAELISSQLSGVLDGASPPHIAVTVVESDNAALSAVASGATVLVVVASGAPVDRRLPDEKSREVATARVPRPISSPVGVPCPVGVGDPG